MSRQGADMIAQYCLVIEEKCYGLHSSGDRQLAFQLALKVILEVPRPVDKGTTSIEWRRNVRLLIPLFHCRGKLSCLLEERKFSTKIR